MVAKAYCGQYEVSLGTEEEQFIGPALDLQKIKKFFFNVHGVGCRERGRQRIRSRLHAVSAKPDTRLRPTNRDHDLSPSQTPNGLSHLGAPAFGLKKKARCAWVA